MLKDKQIHERNDDIKPPFLKIIEYDTPVYKEESRFCPIVYQGLFSCALGHSITNVFYFIKKKKYFSRVNRESDLS